MEAGVDSGKTILVVEDEEFLRQMLAQVFKEAGFTVFEAADGEMGLSIALTKHPDVILLDILLPKMDGITVLKKLRLDTWGKTALIIMLTNLSADNQMLQQVSEAPPSYYFVKSDMEPAELVPKIKEILSQAAPAG